MVLSFGSAIPGNVKENPQSEREAGVSDSRLVGVMGLGLMGTAFTELLLDKGFRVVVWNRTREKAAALLARGAEWGDNPLAHCERVILSLYTSETVKEVLDRRWDAMRPGQIIIDTTTGEPAAAITLGRRLAERGVRYLDSPVSGSSEQVRRGEAVFMVGGEKQAFDACGDLWCVLAAGVHYVGPCGSAARMKLISNLVLGLNRVALAEGLSFAEALGVPPAAALEVLKGSMAYSRAMEVKGRKMVESDFSVQARLSQHLKDVRLILQAAAEAGLRLPLSETHRALMEQAEAAGLGELDNSAIIEVIRNRPANR